MPTASARCPSRNALAFTRTIRSPTPLADPTAENCLRSPKPPGAVSSWKKCTAGSTVPIRWMRAFDSTLSVVLTTGTASDTSMRSVRPYVIAPVHCAREASTEFAVVTTSRRPPPSWKSSCVNSAGTALRSTLSSESNEKYW